MPGNGKEIQIKIGENELKGVYANMMRVFHTPEEFILEFLNVFPPSGVVTARVVVSPQHLKRIVRALEENLKRYEEKFGKIKEIKSDKEEKENYKIGFFPQKE